MNLGGYGSFKVWLNDKQLIAREEEARTELDAFQARCKLKQGYNRVLVQIGYTSDVSSPNFIVRLTDNDYHALSNIKSVSEPQQYTVDNTKSLSQEITHFAEAYFLDQQKKYPNDPAYPFILSRVYLRNQSYEKAKQVMNAVYNKNPDNPFIANYYADCFSGRFENTRISELVEKVKLLDPENFWIISIKHNKLIEEKKYDEARVLLDQMFSMQGKTLLNELRLANLLIQTSKLDSAIAKVKELYSKYSENGTIVLVMAQLYKQVLREPTMYLKVLEDYIKDNHDMQLATMLADEYFERNETEKGLGVLKNIIASGPYDPQVYNPIIQHFFSKQQYDSCIFYLTQVAGISPYNHATFSDIANCYLQKNDKKHALEFYKKALSLYSGGYDYRKRIRELENKSDLFTYFPVTDFYALVKESYRKPFDTAHSYYYISEQRNVIVYKEGASEQVYSAALKINNKDGIDAWKETSIPYNNFYQEVQIIKAEVIKANGSRIPAETSGSQIIFTKLEEGDAIYYSYQLANHGSGRLGREFWDRFYFNSVAPAKESEFNLMIAEELPLYYQLVNDESVKPVEGRKEGFRTYSWTLKDLAGIRDESYMPRLEDIGKVLHVSTVKSWDIIGEWYSDITRMQSREDFELNESFQNIFPTGVSGLKDREKALRIYEFIEKNISYSSVAFRQSAYVPQRAGKTLQTRLGDCKDLSTLFLSFGRKAGLDANLVLVSTRNNGLRNIVLPSMEFNHCIIRYKDNGKYHYLELTDSQLPFGTLTNSLANSQILNIPFEFKGGEVISVLQDEGREKVGYIRNVKMKISNSDLQVSTVLKSNGELARDIRQNYENKTFEESKDALQKKLTESFKNQVLLNNFDFKDLNNIKDTVEQTLDFVVKNDVIEVGDFSMIKPVMIDVVATAGIFSKEKRTYPFEYSNYEVADTYKTVVEVELPVGKIFQEVPSDVTLDFMHMKYSLTYKKEGDNKLRIERMFDTDRTKRLSALDFEKMETLFNKIISAEQKYISFKSVN
jgi:tetratricopeptide (TPR) repeat protein